MNAIAHLSDLHFGTEDPAARAPAAGRARRRSQPRLTVIGGDLTQRARPAPFEAARRFIRRSAGSGAGGCRATTTSRCGTSPDRIVSPLGRYRSYIAPDLCPTSTATASVAVLGLNTTRPARWKEGDDLTGPGPKPDPRPAGQPGGDSLWSSAVVTHHPFIPPPDQPRLAVVGGRATALATLRDAGVDLLLSGRVCPASATAGCWTSGPASCPCRPAPRSRGVRRGQPNGYNVIHLGGRRRAGARDAAVGRPGVEGRLTVPTLRHSPR